MRQRSAQAVVEFALIISVFMLLVLGTFDLSRAYLAYVVVANATREAARYGSAHLSDAGWQAAAIQAGKNVAFGIDVSRLTLSPTTLVYIAPLVNVTGSYPFHSLTPGIAALLGDPITITANTYTLAG